MSSRLTSRALLTLTLLTIICAGPSRAYAQDPIETGRSRQDLTGGAASTRPARTNLPRQVYAPKTRTVIVTKTVMVTPTTGTLFVSSSEPNASILVEPKRGGVEAQVGTLQAGERGVAFNNLKPGLYRVAASLDGYEPVEREVNITRNKTVSVTLNFKPITQNVTVNTNVKTGEIRYAPVEAYKDPLTGETRYKPKGVSSVIPIQNNRAVLTNLLAGTYGVDIRAGEVGYQTLLGTITVPGSDNIKVDLKHLLTTKSFFAAWTRDEWDMPPSWQIASRLLTVNGRGVALPHDESYRYYADFHLASDVRMRNGVAVSFALRAADRQNYYLVQLTGEKADEPYLLRCFVVKNGVPRLMQSIPINHFASTIQPKQFFKVYIKMAGNSMNVSIEDSQTGALLPLGILTDAYQNFPIGALGIAADDKEQSDYGSFMVCTPECPRP